MGHSSRSRSRSRSSSPSRSSRSKHRHERKDRDRDRRRRRSHSRDRSKSPRRRSRFSPSPAPERLDRFGRSMASKERSRTSLDRERDGRSDDDRLRRIRTATELKLADEETKRKIESLVTQRVAEQVEACRREMEKEVGRRVEEAQRQMDLSLNEEMEKRMKVRTEEYEAKECLLRQERDMYRTKSSDLQKELEELQQTTADERLHMLSEKRRLEERINTLKREHAQAQKAVQNTILNKTGDVRKKFSMSLKK